MTSAGQIALLTVYCTFSVYWRFARFYCLLYIALCVSCECWGLFCTVALLHCRILWFAFVICISVRT